MFRSFIKLLLIAIAIYWAAGFFMQRRMLFPAGMANQRLDPNPDLGEAESHWLNTDQGRTEYWLNLAPSASPEKPAGLVVFAHGNAELIDEQQWLSTGFNRLGYSTAMCEFRGYGRSNGSPSEAALTRDFAAMIDEVANRPDVDPQRIIFVGRSVGSGVVCSLARQITPAAMILISPFESVKRKAREMLMPPFLARDPFDNKAVLEDFTGPVLLIHGTRDQVIPFAHSEALHAVVKDSRLESFECGHNDMPVTLGKLWKLVGDFVQDVESREPH